MAVPQFPAAEVTRVPLRHHQPLTPTTIVWAFVAGIATAGPLLAMMGFTFLASITILLISSPLLLIFSPIILPAGFVVCASTVGFSTSAAMAFGGVFAFAWIASCVCSWRGEGGMDAGVTERLTESGRRVKEGRKDHFQHTAEVQPPLKEMENMG